ncbi:MAG TPA: hypothetical protein VFP52_05350 [Myxococcales bacterium]|nr:hypothetical protein [Myxococcales bacterium]HET9752361.1 hypothetical protein [Myxococcales bacterium]
MTPEEARAKVLEFTRRPFAAVAAVEEPDAGGARLLEPGSGKELRLRWDELAGVEEKRSPLRPAPYLVLSFHGGRQLALADVGFAFAPATVNTGPLPDLPPTLCFRDFRHLSDGVEALLAAEGREKEALGAILACIALLDGARAAGLDVSREERKLDALLRALEQRGVKV